MKFVIILLISSLSSSLHVLAQEKVPQSMTSKSDSLKIPDNIFLETKEIVLPGTLVTPAAKAPYPIVLIIAGSGPTDRNGNSPVGIKTDMYKLLAEELAVKGIASIRYDKRYIGKSKVNQDLTKLTFTDYVNDAIDWIKLIKLKHQFSKIFIAGHSEGSLIGILAAEKENIDGFISLAGPSQPIDSILASQYRAYYPDDYLQVKIRLDSLKSGYTLKNIPTRLLPIFNAQTFLKSLLQYNPQNEIKKLTIPILIIQGTTDLQVGISQAEDLKNANKNAELKIIQEMNHVLKLAPADFRKNIFTYNEPELPLHKDLVPAIVQFIYGIAGLTYNIIK